MVCGVQLGVPEGFLHRLRYMNAAGVCLQGFRLSLSEILFGVLRGNKRHPLALHKPFLFNDKRRAFAAQTVSSFLGFRV